MNNEKLIALKEKGIETLKNIYWADSILEFSDIKYQSWMKAKNPSIPDLLLNNSLKVRIDPSSTIMLPMFITRWNSEQELIDNFINNIKKI